MPKPQGTKEQKLAEVMHEVGCFDNHTDGCGWFYDEDKPDPWATWSHKEWLEAAEEVAPNYSEAYVDKVYEAMLVMQEFAKRIDR